MIKFTAKLFCLSLTLFLLAGASAVSADTQNPIQIENTLQGTSDWLVATPQQDKIAGYFGATSYLPGQSATLFVDSKGDPFSYTVYRMGYYQGLGGREITSGTVAMNTKQPKPIIQRDFVPGEKLLVTGWLSSTRITLDPAWASGYYLVKLHDNTNGAESYANFVLQSSNPAQIVVILATNTWQAYNAWGGLSLYRDNRATPPLSSQLSVPHQVSFLRPYGPRSGELHNDPGQASGAAGAGLFFYSDRPLVEWAESNGYPVSYATDYDVRQADEAGPSTKIVLFSGHSEYHSMAERNETLRLPLAGVSEAFLGGNSYPTQARFNDTKHTMLVWRIATLDHCSAPYCKTIRWKWIGLPQSQVTGEMETHGIQTGQQSALSTSSWPWQGTNLTDGANLGQLEGAEYDGIIPKSIPSNLTVLAHTSFGSVGNTDGGAAEQDITLWQRTPNAFVFSAGQTGFNWRLSDPAYSVNYSWVDPTYPTTSQVSPIFQTLVANLIAHALGQAN